MKLNLIPICLSHPSSSPTVTFLPDNGVLIYFIEHFLRNTIAPEERPVCSNK